ncbi:sarcosine oxidase subunit alpha family protein [Thalassospira sp.]|uniref:sarcosine oxidase subunit alpha family protein n=1 Tax=Thalassospira sp. TaxID=1912094 RepID=UPI0027377044|nr:sarcosine oxidase subunit alpha family protein [Thalassospira sp.]MDP2697472.1 sarcosine oxidase subunit alpha family protein [Thalassospira sp.]
MSDFRIPGRGMVDPGQPCTLVFDGKRYDGLAGDSVASALLANGVHLVGRSYKYHRPRGILSAGSEEPNALIAQDRGDGRFDPNSRATMQELYDGLECQSQNRFPSLAHDIGAINDLAAPLFSAGFYYKTFMWPKSAWRKLYEPVIRRMAGLGKAPDAPDPDHYSTRYHHCDVLIAGGGVAGLASALAAADSGADVVLCDEHAVWGGSLCGNQTDIIDGLSAQDWIAGTIADLQSRANVLLLPRTTCYAYYAQNYLGLCERLSDHVRHPDTTTPRQRLWQIRARRVILATGALERPLVFPGNDRPGVMLASAARICLDRYGVLVGRKIVIFAAEDSAYGTALELASVGAKVTIVDLRPETAIAPDPLHACRKADIPVLAGHVMTGTKGRLRITQASICAHQDGVFGPERHLACDAMLMAGGWTPTLHLYSQSRGKVVWDPERKIFIPGPPVQDEQSVGAARGTLGLQDTLAESFAAGLASGRAAIGGRKGRKRVIIATETAERGTGFLGAVPLPHAKIHARAFVDFQHDVTSKDIKLAVREGFHSIEHVKRYTTTGMATDQGKTSNMHGLAIAAHQLGKDIPAVGLTTFRQPYTPVTFGALVGYHQDALFDPRRKTPTHDRAVALGAVFEPVGLWLRALYFPKGTETRHQAVHRECLATRQSVGLFDASTLGKIEIVGPDAATFMELLYTNPWQKLPVGRCRYGVMLREDGFVFDDGVVARLAPNRFHVTTTTGGAPRVLAHMEDYLQTEFPHLKLRLTSTTEQWATLAINGPRARDVVAKIVDDIDVSAHALPHMAARCGHVLGGIPARLFRISFTGETGFEINVPAAYGAALWDALMLAGAEFGITPYGTETMHVLRAEKGYIITGQDTDGTVTPIDAGLGWAIGKAKRDFVGKRSLARPDIIATERRKHLVGLKTLDPMIVLQEGAQIVLDPNQPIPMTMSGHVTSAYHSPVLGRSIALALVENGHNRMGETVFIPMPDTVIRAEICSTVFYDPTGERLNG